jgi:energy-coupling factor transport system permease protein
MLTGTPSSSPWRSFHPLVVTGLLASHVILAFLWEYHPLLQTGQLLFLLAWAVREGCLRQAVTMFRIGVWFTVVFVVVNPLFSSLGERFLWRGPIVAYFGRLDVTAEELLYSVMGVIRLYSILILSVMYQRFVDHDRFFFLFAKAAPRFVMTAVMAFRLFPYLSQEFARIREIAHVRGIRPRGPGLREKLRYTMLIMRPLLFGALEGSWLTAETLYARGFGSGPRSSYRTQPLKRREWLGLLMIGGMLLVAVWGRWLSFGAFAYFPALVWTDPLGDTLFLAGLTALWLLPIIWLKGETTDEQHSAL